MKYKIVNSESWTQNTLEEFLLRIFLVSDLGWISEILRRLRIPNRSKIYTAFQHSYYYAQKRNIPDNTFSSEREQIQAEERQSWIKKICENRDIALEIIDNWLEDTSLGRIAFISSAVGLLNNPLFIEIRQDSNTRSDDEMVDMPDSNTGAN